MMQRERWRGRLSRTWVAGPYGTDAQEEEVAGDIKERMEYCCKGDLEDWSRIPCTIMFYISLNDTQAFNFASPYTTQHRKNSTCWEGKREGG